ncbi:MAG: lysozyme inhibitor LprI family protein [Methyloceanibacter sp.]
MRPLILAFTLLVLPLSTSVKADIVATCYSDCAAETDSNPTLKACLSRVANKADRLLNQSYQTLQDAIRKSAQEMEQSPDPQLAALTAAQKQWIAFRDENCAFEDSLAFGGTATGGNYSGCYCALSYERINDFDRIREQVIGE